MDDMMTILNRVILLIIDLVASISRWYIN